MKLERISEYITTFVVLLIGLGLALYVGQLSGGGNYRNVLMLVGGALVVCIGLTMKQNIWILILLTLGLNGRIIFLPLPFTVREAGILLAFGWFIIFRAVKMINRKQIIEYVDIILFANLAFLLFAFCRNPVGVLLFETDLVGGRPYVSVIIAVFGYWVLSLAFLTPNMARWLPGVTLVGSLTSLAFGLVSHFIPSSVPILSRIYSGISPYAYLAQENVNGGDAGGESQRIVVLGGPGKQFFLWLCCYFRPITLINPLYLVRFLLFAGASLLVFLSGYRSYLIFCFGIYILANYYRGRISDTIKTCVMGVPVLMVMVLGHGVLFELPLSAQRALSYMPGSWSREVEQDASGSIKWRTEMWRIMWESDKYLKNWWIGDGFGYSAQALNEMRVASGGNDFAVGQENFLITGQVHNGPLSTIRYVGYIGLVLYIVLILAMAKKAHRLILRSRNTPFFYAALFIGTPIIVHPFFFLVIFGSFDSDMPATILALGMLNLLSRGFSQYIAEQEVSKESSYQGNSRIDWRPPLLT